MCFSKKILLWISFVFLFSGCSQQKLNYVPESKSIVAFGDSLTFGYSLDKKDNYPSQLSKLIGRNVVNEGYNGITSDDAVFYTKKIIEEDNPGLVILCLGGNDMLQHKDLDIMVANLEKIIQQLQTYNVQVLLVGVPTPNPFYISSNPKFLQIAKDMKIPIENDVLVMVEKDQELKIDPVHPNKQGYAIIAEKLSEDLKDLGAI